MYYAAGNGYLEMVRLLAEDPLCNLMLGKDLNQGKIDNRTRSEIKNEIAADRKDEEGLRSLFFLPESVVITPLHCAFFTRREAVVRYLLDKSPQAARDSLVTALSAALPQLTDKQRDFLSKFPELERAASSATCQISNHIDTIYEFFYMGEEALAISQMKTLKKEEIDFREVFFTASWYGANKMLKSLFTEYVEEMKKVIWQDELYVACAIAHFLEMETIDRMLDLGAAIVTTGAEGVSAIHTAIERNNMPALLRLLDRFPSSIEVSSHGETPLLCAASLDWDEAVGLLLSKRANPLALHEDEKKNPLFIFIMRRKLQLLRQVFEQFPLLDLSPSQASNVGMPYLTGAFKIQEANLFITLFEHGARDTDFLKDGQALNWLRALNNPEIMQWVEKIQEEKRASANKVVSAVPTLPEGDARNVSGKKPYRDGLKKQLEGSSEDSVYDNNVVLFEPVNESFTWFDVLSSDQNSVVAISGAPNLFLYLDVPRLTIQGLNLDALDAVCRLPKMNGDSIKTLQFKHIKCSISLNGNAEDSYLMAELRFPNRQELKEKRIFLWPVLDKSKRATLLVGFDFSNALHEQKDIKALIQSFRTTKLIELSGLMEKKSERKNIKMM